jgi:transposase-like protein
MRTYTQEEKQAVIDRVISGELSTHILADTGIPKSTFYGWLRAYREEQEADNRRTVSIRNFHLLENKVARLESIVEILKEPLNKLAAALSGSFAPTFQFENLEIHKVFLQFSNLNLEQNPSLTALAI